MRLLSILIIAVCCSIQCAFAQFNRLFTSDHELPNSLINDVTEGPDEMIWVATEDGLCRFDGSSFTTYRNDPKNPNSLANNFVRTLCADEKGHLLIGTLAGVQMYRPESDDFTPVLVDESVHVGEANVNHINLLRNGDFFIAGTLTFTVHIDEQGNLQALTNPFSQRVSLTHRSAEDAYGNIWVTQENHDLYLLDTKGEVTLFKSNGQSLNFQTLACDQEGVVYAAGAGSGIYKYDKQKNDFVLITTPEQNYSVRDFCPVPGTSQMYVGTDGAGAKILDCKTGQIVSFIFDDSSVDASTQKVHAITISKNGEVWMALYQKGVFEMARNPLQFRYFGYKSMRYNCIGDRCITSLLRLHDGTIWVATDNGGLYGINQQGQTLKHYPFTQQPNSVPASFMNIFEDSKHRVWFGSFSQGGGTVDLATGRCTYYPIVDQDGLSANFYAFVEDRRGDIWAASMGLGILRLNEKTQQFEQIYARAENGSNWACTMEYDEANDVLYVGSYNGLFTASLGGDSIAVENTFDSYIIFSITQYPDNKLVLSTNQGLILYDTNLRTHRRYTTEDGLPNDNIYAALVDNEGNIWMSSNVGLSKLNVEQTQVTNYTVRDGLQGNEFYKNSAMRDSDGTLWFGGTNGITWFKPLSIYQQNQDFVVRIVNCRSYQVNYFADDEGTYNLTEDCHAFSIEMATRPIMLTSRVLFRYSMDGDRWQTLPPGENRVTFARMPSGKHEFRYQAVLDGVGSEVVTSTIFIAYPWYRSWWATILWLSILVLIVWLSASLLWRRVQMRRRLREHHQHEAINEAKLQFFMNISHEFRTPMTLILTPLQKLISIDHDAQRQRSYKLIERNANRILSLINELMDLRKIDAEQMQIMCKPTLIVPHVKDLCSTVSDMAEVRKINLQVISSMSDDTSILLDATCFEKILINLLSNALKYTPEGGSVKVLMRQGSTSKKFPEGSFQIEVSDTGIGIPASERAHIFERFYQVRNDISHSVGTGIGLNLVYSLVQLHHGEIEVADTPTGTGTSFIVSLPLGTTLYTADEIRTKREEVEGMYHVPEPMPVIAKPVVEIPEPEAPEQEKPAASHKEIAVVEDDEEIRKYIISELSPFYHVKGYPDGKQALEALLTGKFDLVLSDMMMPEMNGEELCRRIRANVRLNHLPVIMLTALTSDEDRLKGLEIGVNAYLTKPFNIEVLKKTIQNLLESQDRLRNNFSGQQLPADQIETPDLKSPDERLLERVIKVVSENLNNPDLTTDMIAKEIGISRVHLYRKLKELTNQSARNFFRNIRLAKAAELLSKKKMAVSEVAYKVGFANPNNFATAFKELYGISPTQYMEGHRPEPTTFVPNFVDEEPKDADAEESENEASAD